MRLALIGLFLARAGLAYAEPPPTDERIEFEAGSAQVQARWRTVLQKAARALKQNPWMALELRGHATALEKPTLAHARAEAVRARLVALGAPRTHLSVVDGEPADLRDLRPPRYVKLHVVAARAH